MLRSEGLGWKREWINDWKKNNYKKLYTVLSYLGVCTFCICCILICLVCIVASFNFSCVYCCQLSCVYCCSCVVCIVVSCLVCIVVVVLCVLLLVVLCVLLSSYVYLLYCVCIAVFTLDAGLLARIRYSEGPVTGHLDTGFSWFPCVYKQMLRWFPTFQVATTCFSCSPPDLNLLVTNFIFCIHVK